MARLNVDSMLTGAVDLHVHPGPSPFPRRLGLLDAATDAAEAGFYAIAAKSHHHSTITDVLAIESAVGSLPIKVLGGVCLNQQVGGINPSAVELALALGARIVWLPTIAAANHLASEASLERFPRDGVGLRRPAPVQIFAPDGRPRPEVLDILDLVSEADAVLACGHLSAAEISALIPVAHEAGVTRIVVHHPNFVIGADPSVCAGWARQNVVIEHSLCHYLPDSSFCRFSLETLLDYVSVVGSDRTALSSDLGQVGNPTPVEGFRWIVEALNSAGVSAPTIRHLVRDTARALID